ncbi:hypothetical protein ACA910_016393 [Epithemia clementina (nom. ined.)]
MTLQHLMVLLSILASSSRLTLSLTTIVPITTFRRAALGTTSPVVGDFVALKASIAYSAGGSFGYSGENDYFLLDDNHFRTRSIREFLQTEALDRLARLAVAFSPLERAIKLADIKQVSIISIDDRSIDIMAMLCEDDGCVSLSIPIDFPKACTESDDYDTCVVDNIGALDIRANEVLLKLGWDSQLTDEGFDVEYQMKLLRETHGLVYPDWWVSPTVAEDCMRESRAILDLLNEDEFARDVQHLALSGLQQAEPQANHVVELATVAAVGPAGLIMRACVRDHRTDQLRMAQVPLAFDVPVSDVDSLRGAVLSIVASVDG